MTVTLLTGDVRDMLATLPAASVHCVVTSPPYWGMRDYGTATWEGGDAGCNHVKKNTGEGKEYFNGKGSMGSCTSWADRKQVFYNSICGKCGAHRIDRQLGLEETPGEHVANIVEVFREVRRVLRKDGTCWVNYGDCYTGPKGFRPNHAISSTLSGGKKHIGLTIGSPVPSGLKPKDLIGMPWRVAFALQADGWWLRSDIIWAKSNPMPESVTDRPTKSHEYVFLLTKSAKYFYDANAIKEPSLRSGDIPGGSNCRGSDMFGVSPHAAFNGKVPATRNLRSVWNIPTAPFSEAHFATFPPKLAETCILAGTSAKGCCPVCGAPWVRTIAVAHEDAGYGNNNMARKGEDFAGTGSSRPYETRKLRHVNTTGWRPACACPPAAPIPCTVLDIFAGAGTTLMVADRLQRHAIGIELNADYCQMIETRLRSDGGLFIQVDASVSSIHQRDDLPSIPLGSDTNDTETEDFLDHATLNI